MISEQQLPSYRNSTAGYFVYRSCCPVCSNDKKRLLVNEPFDDGPIYEHIREYYKKKGLFEPHYLEGAFYRVVECTDCRLIFQEFVPNDELLCRIYAHWTFPEAAATRNLENLGSNVQQYVKEQLLLKYWSNDRKLRVLDYGMGHGRWCEIAYAFGHKVYGYEFEDTREKNATQRGVVNVVAYDDIAKGEFDFINAEQVFEHLTQPMEVLRHLVKGLKPGGMIRIGVPSGILVKRNLSRGTGYDFRKRQRFGLNPIEPLQHLNCFTAQSLVRLGNEAGLNRYLFPIIHLIAAQQNWRFPKGFLYNILHPLYTRLRYNGGSEQYFQKIPKSVSK
ncbi:MAG: hypothetical protein QOH96_2034 [Blastocatellia bacterium]|nr:hypothetical protein [Blastocatellia bacterium]